MQQAIWFVVVTFYPKDVKLVNLTNALKDWPVVIVDNTPLNQASKEKFKWPENITLIQNWANLGYGAGANKGISYALKQGAEWVVVLNDDLDLLPQMVANLCRLLLKTPPGIAGPFVGELDQRRWTTIYPSAKADYISGSCFAIHRDVINKIGYFYSPYFIYYEEVDYCFQAQQVGFPLTHLALSGIDHQESATIGRGSFLHEYYHARNHLLFAERCAPWSVKIYELLRLPKTIYEHLTRGEKGGLLGIRDYFLRRFGVFPEKI